MKNYSLVTLFTILGLLLSSMPMTSMHAAGGGAPAVYDAATEVGHEGWAEHGQAVCAVESREPRPRAPISKAIGVDGSILVATSPLTSTLFEDIGAGLVGVYKSSLTWGDYDNDGDLDVLLMGCVDGACGTGVSKVYRNDGADLFTDINAALTGVAGGSAAWGDYDNDGDLDILLIGGTVVESVARVYRNDGSGIFTDIHASLPGTTSGSVAWGDYDNDGDLDILITGWSVIGYIAKVYRNVGDDGFVDAHVSLDGVWSSSAAWGDYDNDGDLDILLAGMNVNSARIAKIYRNDGAGVFTDINAALSGVEGGSVAWGDYDNDGDLDILLTGGTAVESIAKVYRNVGNDSFVDIGAGLPGVVGSCAAWGDYDNDGDLDIVLAGYWEWVITRIYRNDGGSTFTDIDAGLTPSRQCDVAWGDYDNDGDLDLQLAGEFSGSQIYRNNTPAPNTIPTAPSGLTASMSGAYATLSWNPSSDVQTPSAGLTYNLRVGTTPGGQQLVSPMAATTGLRQVPDLGGANHRTFAILRLPQDGTYYWGVQAVDTAWAGSTFAAERSFVATKVPDNWSYLPVIVREHVVWPAADVVEHTTGGDGRVVVPLMGGGAATFELVDLLDEPVANIPVVSIATVHGVTLIVLAQDHGFAPTLISVPASELGSLEYGILSARIDFFGRFQLTPWDGFGESVAIEEKLDWITGQLQGMAQATEDWVEDTFTEENICEAAVATGIFVVHYKTGGLTKAGEVVGGGALHILGHEFCETYFEGNPDDQEYSVIHNGGTGLASSALPQVMILDWTPQLDNTAGIIFGQAVDANSGIGIPGVTVTLDGVPQHTFTTLTEGGYRFAGISPGTHSLTATRPGYTSDTVNVQVTANQMVKAPALEIEPISSGIWRIQNDTGGMITLVVDGIGTQYLGAGTHDWVLPSGTRDYKAWTTACGGVLEKQVTILPGHITLTRFYCAQTGQMMLDATDPVGHPNPH